MIHADPNFEQPANSSGRKGFNEFLNALEREVIRYGKPVLLATGIPIISASTNPW